MTGERASEQTSKRATNSCSYHSLLTPRSSLPPVTSEEVIMNRRRAFLEGATLLLVACTLPAGGAAQRTAMITVGTNVHVSGSLPKVPHREVLIAADPENADRLIGCSIFKAEHGLYAERTAVFTSNDRGKSW